jgi:uncharacterized protein (DUF111 family)
VIHLDAREGLSADMLLAASMGLLPPETLSSVLERMHRAADGVGLSFHYEEVREEGDSGLAVSYVPRTPPPSTTSHPEAYSLLSSVNSSLGSDGEVARRILDRIFEAEAAAHGLPPEEVHLHEIGRPEALMNIAGIGLVVPMLMSGDREFLCSTITTGRGVTTISHGIFRVPAPATAFLLEGLKHAAGDHPGERATPTGVAAVSVLATGHSDDVPKEVLARSTGFGTKRFAGRLGRVVMTISGHAAANCVT